MVERGVSTARKADLIETDAEALLAAAAHARPEPEETVLRRLTRERLLARDRLGAAAPALCFWRLDELPAAE